MHLYFRLVKESLVLSLSALRNNRLRTILSLLGITIGIFAIIAVFTMVTSMELMVKSSVASLGDDVVFVQKWPWPKPGEDYTWWKYWQRPEPKLKELYAINDRVTTAESACFIAEGNSTVETGNSSMTNVRIQCVSHDYSKVRTLKLSKGRYFSPLESSGGRNYTILGANVADELFPSDNPIGKKVKIRGNRLEVIGVFELEGESMVGSSVDDVAMIPVVYAQKVYNIEELNPWIMIKANQGIALKQLMDETQSVMRRIRRLRPDEDDDFALNESSVLSSAVDDIFGYIALVGGIIGGFSIVVGGFSVANIMFVSVKERTAQIGIQKALGAKRSFILFQFLFEAIILSVIGGAIGLLLVWFGAVLFSWIMDFDIILTFENVTYGLAISAVIGIVSGVIPAWRASRLDPVEAIRS